MAKRQIRISTDEVLRKICKPVKEITPNTLTLLDDMAETMYDSKRRWSGCASGRRSETHCCDRHRRWSGRTDQPCHRRSNRFSDRL